MDFTAEKYRQLCQGLVNAGYTSIRFADYVSKGLPADHKTVLLRHDVDRFAGTALPLAKIEHDLGLSAAYYFRVPGTLSPEVISQVVALGHEIGLHYEVLDKARGDMQIAAEYLNADLANLRALAPVQIAAMHGNPRTPYNNLHIWEHLRLSDYGLIGEAYLSVNFPDFLYFSDTGRTWHPDRFNIYDHAPKTEDTGDMPLTNTTDDLIAVINSSQRNLYVLTHPERWPALTAQWLISWGMDKVANPLKLLFQFFYRLR